MLKYKKYKNRKAQLEIVGLLIIVILVVIVIAIIMKFKISEQPRQIKKDYMYDQMSTSFLLSFLRALASGSIPFLIKRIFSFSRAFC